VSVESRNGGFRDKFVTKRETGFPFEGKWRIECLSRNERLCASVKLTEASAIPCNELRMAGVLQYSLADNSILADMACWEQVANLSKHAERANH
jgi:hypothetical protein